MMTEQPEQIIVCKELENEIKKAIFLSLKEKGIAFSYDEKAQEYLAHKAYGGRSGARDLRNLIRKEVEDKIASAIVDSRTGSIAGIHVSADEEGIKLEVI